MKKTCDIRRVLISVSNKEGIVELAHGLSELGVEILSTGGTSKTLRQVELRVKDVSDLTGFPEILDGRVKTLHPKVFGGLLSLRGKPSHTQDMEKYGIEPIDMVIVNLYPFESICGDTSLPEEELLEYIDIGGSALLRAASKNFRNVAPLVDPEDYAPVLEELKERGTLALTTRRRLAAKAFGHTAHYDAVIASVFRQKAQVKEFPEEIAPSLRKKADLRYGENPHQKAALYQESGTRAWGVVGAKILQGKQVSFNNYMDCDAAWRLVSSFTNPTAVIIKHNNPCGVAESETLAEAFRQAYAADSLSAFGGGGGVQPRGGWRHRSRNVQTVFGMRDRPGVSSRRPGNIGQKSQPSASGAADPFGRSLRVGHPADFRRFFGARARRPAPVGNESGVAAGSVAGRANVFGFCVAGVQTREVQRHCVGARPGDGGHRGRANVSDRLVESGEHETGHSHHRPEKNMAVGHGVGRVFPVP